MSPAHVLEPTYRRLKRSLMEGLWPPGAKLEAMKLADDFGVSMTPVRDSLNRLAGENLVELQPGEGYRVPRLSEGALRDMLKVNAILLISALQKAEANRAVSKMQIDGADLADQVAATFAEIADGSRNMILAEMVRSLSERLHQVRKAEALVLPETASELRMIRRLFQTGDPALENALRSYHQRRQSRVTALIQVLH